MLSILMAAGICLLVPALLLYLTARFSPDLRSPTVPADDLSRWQQPSSTAEPAIQSGSPEDAPWHETEVAAEEDAEGRPAPQPLRRSFLWFNVLMLPVFFLSATAATVGWSYVLIALYRQRIAELPPSLFLIEPGWAMCITPAIFLGIFTAAVPMDLVGRLLLGRRYQDFQEWERGRLGLENREAVRRLMRGLGVLIVLPLTLFVALSMDWYARFGEEEIGINRFWGFGERTYSYDRVKHVVQTTHLKPLLGPVKQRNRLFLVFDDGRVWGNEDVVQTGPHFKDDLKMIAFVCRKSGKPLQTVQFLEDATGP